MAAIRKVEDLSTDPEFIGYYDLEEAHKWDIEDAKLTEKIEIAINLLKKGVDIVIISESTGLSIEELNKLKIEE